MTVQDFRGSDAMFQRARGLLSISAVGSAGNPSRLENLRQQGSYRAVFPRSTQRRVDAVIINTAGGITGGDKFSTTIFANPHARISATTQAAERIYRAVGGTVGSMHTRLRVKSKAQLYWLPQETILFDGSHLNRRLDVEVAQDAKFLMVEPLVFGRAASGEILKSCILDDRVRISSLGTPIYLDRIKLNGDIAATLRRSALANGARAMASIVLVDPMAAELLEPVRNLLPSTAGASLFGLNILVIRLLSSDSFELRKVVFPILKLFTQNRVPKNWRL